ncbi:ketopantoate reductase family protein [Paracoccus jeotgali]|uniref:2-dehydropantoate 2-reductase n=1 Tax=Paracoccus jeotgali TaxID=2065379 RepID=A0A2K9MEA5_9RHOB|nr:2-dehydropantoate 2-reductase [Paracoccus jeotgali]AUM73971.1 2-dehydropantoate 2-reductase [Paracoccus jeotgali]
MKIAIIGAGAMGSLFAWQLVKTGAEVVALDQWAEHVQAMQRDGLIVECAGHDLHVPLTATNSPKEIGTCDIILFFVKYGQTTDAAQWIAPLVGPETLLVTLQNGVGNADRIAEVHPDNAIAYGLTTLTSEMLGPGRIEASFAGKGETYFWRRGGQPDSREEYLKDLLNAGDYAAELDPDIDLRIWKKLVINCCFNTICGLLDCTVGETMHDPETARIFDALIAELSAVAAAKGIGITPAAARSYLEEVGRDAASHVPSMAIDLRAGRQTEIECLNGAILREGARLAIPTPTHALIYNLIRAREQISSRRQAMGG